jgi:hypothetical protein
MTVEEIFSQFNSVYTDNQSELGTEELFILLNKAYTKIINDRDWYFLETNFQGTLQTGETEIDIPENFKKMVMNHMRNGQPEIVVYVGPGNNPNVYHVIPRAKARMYQDIDGFCYLDMKNKKLVFTRAFEQPDLVSYEYIEKPPKLENLEDEPIIPMEYHHAIVHAMAEEYPIIDQMERQFSFSRENESYKEKILEDLRLEDANIKNNT